MNQTLNKWPGSSKEAISLTNMLRSQSNLGIRHIGEVAYEIIYALFSMALEIAVITEGFLEIYKK